MKHYQLVRVNGKRVYGKDRFAKASSIRKRKKKMKEVKSGAKLVLITWFLASSIAIFAGMMNLKNSFEVVNETFNDVCSLSAVQCAGEEYENVIAYVTAYSEFDSCHYENCAMFSGKRAYIGAVACPTEYKIGTEVIIDGITYTCEDRTAKRYDGRFDIFMGYAQESYDKAWDYGKQLKTITIKK